MMLPVIPQILNGKGESFIGIPNKQSRLFLRTIGMNRISMAEPVRVIVTDNRLPITRILNLQLDSKLDNAPSATLVGTAEPNLIDQKINGPLASLEIRISHSGDSQLVRITPSEARAEYLAAFEAAR